MTEQDLKAWAEWEDTFFDLEGALRERERAAVPKGKAKPKRKSRAPVTIKQIRGSAYQHLKGLDKTLCNVLGQGLKQFRVDNGSTENEVGINVSNRQNPLREFDKPLPDTLCLHFDEGSSGFAMTWFILFVMDLRFVGMRDVFHREWNDVKLALGDEQVWWVILLTTMVFNLPYGPWMTEGWWCKMIGAATAYTTMATWTSPVFSALYELICKDMGIQVAGTPEHRQLIFESLLTSEAFSSKGVRVALRRWFSWVDSFFMV